MLSRSIVAALCGALVVAGRPGQHEYGYNQENVDPYAGYGQAAFAQMPPMWTSVPDTDMSWNPFEDHEDHPKHPPGPPHPHPVPQPPHPSHHNPKYENKTIYQALEEDTRFTRLFKLVNFTEDVVIILNDSNADVTFFAVPDKALRPPKRHHKKSRSIGLDFDSPEIDPFYNTVAAELSTSEDELEMFATLEGFVDYSLFDNDDDDKERKRKIIKKIVTAVLKYHILPGVLPAQTLATNNTYSSGLKLSDASLDSEALRVRISSDPRLIVPQARVNFYASIIHPDVKTENGLVHVLNHPLFPPPSIFTILFGFSDIFSTLTSAIQRVNITDDVDWHWVKSSHTLEGSPAVTFFAPTNKAFRTLPPKLKHYLFSPFGARALKKILAYHVAPEYIFHTNWAHNASDSLVARSNFVDVDAYSYLDAGAKDSSEFHASWSEQFMNDDFFGDRQWRDDVMERESFPPPPPFESPIRHGPARFPPPPFPPPPPPPPFGHPHPQCPRPGPPPPHFPPFERPNPWHEPPRCPPPPHHAPFEAPPPPPFEYHHSECPRPGPPPPRFPHFAPPESWHEPPRCPPPPPHPPFEAPPPPPFQFPHSAYPRPGPPPPHFPPFERRPPSGPWHEPNAPPHFPPPPPHFPPPGSPPPPCHKPAPPPPPPPHFPHSFPPPPPPPPPPPHFPHSFPPPPPPHCGYEQPGHPKHPKFPHPKPVYTHEAALPSLLSNHTLHVHVAQFHSILPHGGYVTRVRVNGQPVLVADVPTRNGAVHVVDRLIRPFRKSPHHEDKPFGSFDGWFEESGQEFNNDWDDWEEWLPQWANED